MKSTKRVGVSGDVEREGRILPLLLPPLPGLLLLPMALLQDLPKATEDDDDDKAIWLKRESGAPGVCTPHTHTHKHTAIKHGEMFVRPQKRWTDEDKAGESWSKGRIVADIRRVRLSRRTVVSVACKPPPPLSPSRPPGMVALPLPFSGDQRVSQIRGGGTFLSSPCPLSRRKGVSSPSPPPPLPP